MWTIATTAEFDGWFESLGQTEEGRTSRIEIAATMEILGLKGPMLGRPLVDTLKGSKHANLKELRIRTAAMAIRIAFAFDPLQMGILLVGGDKSGVNQARFYRQLIGRAEEIYDRHLASITKQIAAKKRADKHKKRGR
jgi:hypothetical protein